MNSINPSYSVRNPVVNYNVINDLSPVNYIPQEIWKLIASFLDDCKDVIHLGLSNRKVSVILCDVPLWEIFLERDFRDSSVHLKSNLPAPALYKQLAIVANHMRTPEHYRLKTLNGHDDIVIGIKIYEGNLVSCSWDNTIKIWDLKTGKVMETFEIDERSTCSAIYNRKKIISASGESGTIQILDLETKVPQTVAIGQRAISCIAVYDDQLFCGSYDGTIKILNLKTEPAKMQEEIETLNTGQFMITSLAAGAGKLFCGAADCTIKVYDLKTKKMLTLEGHQHKINCMTVWGNKLISCSVDQTIKIWDFNTGKLLRTLVGHSSSVEDILVYDDRLISSSLGGMINIWDLKTGKVLQTIQCKPCYCINFYDGNIISSSYSKTIETRDFKFPSLSPYSRQTLEENLEILGKMAHFEYIQQPQAVEELAKKLHPDVKRQLKQHSLNIGVPFSCSAKVILRVQTEVCIEALLHTIHAKDHRRVSQLLEQIICIDPQNAKIYELLWKICGKPDFYRWGEYAFHNQQNCSASIPKKEQATLDLEQILIDRWKAEDLSLLVNLGIVTDQEYSVILNCTPDALSKRGIYSDKDLQVLFNSPHFEYLKPISEEITEDRIQLRTRAFAKQKIVFDFLNQLLAAAQQKSEETAQCSVVRDENGNVYEAPNPWIDFQEELKSCQAKLSEQALTRDEFLAKFDSESYPKIVGEVNGLIDKFRTLERGTQILRLRAYLSQVDILSVWASLQSEGIENLSTLVDKGMLPPNLFAMGK